MAARRRPRPSFWTDDGWLCTTWPSRRTRPFRSPSTMPPSKATTDDGWYVQHGLGDAFRGRGKAGSLDSPAPGRCEPNWATGCEAPAPTPWPPASSVCRQRAADAPTVSRREFIRELNAALPEALLDMTRGGVNSPIGAGGLVAGHHRPRHGHLQPVRRRAGGRRQAPMRVKHRAAAHQPLPGRRRFHDDTQFCLAWFRAPGLGHR